MTVKTGSAWAGTFVTLDATGALATPSSGPAGVLYVDGTANAATVTITGSNPYKWAVTLPSLTAGQRVDMYITATIATIATAGIVASAQADTTLLSDGVAVASIANGAITAAAIADNAIDAGAIATGAITNAKFAAGAIDASAVADNAIDAASVKADAVTKIQTGLATSTALATVDANVDAILDDTGTSGVLLSTSALGSIFDDEAVVGTYTMRQLLKVFAAALAGKATGGGTTTITFRGVDDASNVIVATVDASGNRSAVTLTV